MEAFRSSSLGGFFKNRSAVAVSLELILAIISWCPSLVRICIAQAGHLSPQDSTHGSIRYTHQGAKVLLGLHGTYNSGLKKKVLVDLTCATVGPSRCVAF